MQNFMPMSDLAVHEYPHRRLNILTGEWVLVSPHRTKRPWQGKMEKQAPATRPSYDPGCYLCPGNRRAEGETNLATLRPTFLPTTSPPCSRS